ncbi:MAG: peptidase M22 [Clostridia bacterium]
MKNFVLGLDTSNYTTSSAVFDGENILQSKKLLPVAKGELGIRQSDAVFHHTKQLPEVLANLLPKNLSAIGVSEKPRSLENSYMPCFLVGLSTAEILGNALNIPVYKFSHQQGHIAAALYSAKRLDLLEKDFVAFHLSGGTSEAVLVSGGVLNKIEIISETLDLNAGQAVDRVGVMLGLQFPCGKELDKLAQNCEEKIKVRASIKGMDFCLSGLQNQCENLHKKGEKPEYIAKYCLEYISANLDKICEKITDKYRGLPIVFSGGVASNSLIQKRFKEKYKAYFASPEFSCDNAAGIAVLARHKGKI